MQDLNQVHKNVKDSDVLKESRGAEDKIHTDPLTGYSTLCRPDKRQPTSNQIPFYESVKVKDVCLHSGAGHQYSTLKQDSDPPLTTSHTPSHNSAKEDSPIQSQTLLTIKDTVPTDPMTGYSSMLRPGKVVPPPGPVPPYDVISMQHRDTAVITDTNVAQSGSHTSPSISSSHNPKVQEPDLPPESFFDYYSS